MLDDAGLIAEARRHVGPFRLAAPDYLAAEVGAALLTRSGLVCAGVSIHLACGIGFCAEHSAVAAMLMHRQTEVAAIVAVGQDGSVMPPCGRCRELLLQVDARNRDCRVLLPGGRDRPLSELLPDHWM
jgi:cytidine deaminase